MLHMLKIMGYDIVVFKVDGVNTTTKTTIRGELEIYGKYSNPTHIVVGIIYTDGTSIDRVVGVHIGNDKYRVVGNQHVYEVSRQ